MAQYTARAKCTEFQAVGVTFTDFRVATAIDCQWRDLAFMSIAALCRFPGLYEVSVTGRGRTAMRRIRVEQGGWSYVE